MNVIVKLEDSDWRIRSAIESAGIRRVAEEIGYTPSFVSMFVRGKRGVPVGLLLAAISASGKPVPRELSEIGKIAFKHERKTRGD